MSEFKIIDPHIHYWDAATTPRTVTPLVQLFGRFPKLLDWVIRKVVPIETQNYFGPSTAFTIPYLPDVYFREAGKYRDRVRGVVHIQADWQAKGPLHFADETAWLDSLDQPPLAIVGEARINHPKALNQVLDAHVAASGRFRGIRDMLAYHRSKTIHNFNEAEDTMQTEAFRQGYAQLGKRGFSFDAFIFSHQLRDLCELVEAIPETPIVVDHMATPIGLMGPYGEFGTTESMREQIKIEWIQGLQRLAQSPHVHMKLSGMFMHVLGWDHHSWAGGKLTVDQVVEYIGPHVKTVLDIFGVDRCMFATNFPPDRSLMQYETYYDAYFKIVAELSTEDQQKLFHDNAARFYRID